LLGTGAGGGGGCSDTNATAWVSAVVTAGGTVSAGQQTNVCNLIVGLKAASLYSTVMDRIWLYASENAQQASIDIINLATHTLHSSPTFTANQGYAKGSAGYIDTNFVPSTAGGHYSLNSASFGYCDLTSSTVGESGVSLGINNLAWIINNQGGVKVYDANDGNFPGSSNVQHQGLWAVSRTAASGAGALSLYVGGSSTPVVSSTGASSTLPTISFYSLAANNAGTATRSTADTLALTFIGGALTGAQYASLYTLLAAYLTAVGASGC